MKRTIVVVDDHPAVRDGIRAALERERDVVVIGESNGHGALAFVRAQNPDLLVLDLSLGEHSGLDLLRQLRHELPNLRTLVLSMHTEEEQFAAAVSAGAHGYLTKEASTEAIVAAVHAVLAGATVFDDRVGRYVKERFGRLRPHDRTDSDRYDRLTAREQQVFRLLAEGLSTKETAWELNLAHRTVENYQTAIFHKLELKSSAELVRLAIDLGIL